MRILLVSSYGNGCWFSLRWQREGHSVQWFQPDDHPRFRRVLRGIGPKPIPPDADIDLSEFDFCVFDSTGHGELADEILKSIPVIGDGSLNSRLEDDRLYGIQMMEEAGIEVPFYETFDNPEEAKKFIEEHPRRYVYKPFTPNGEQQECDTTYVSDSASDMIRYIDELYKDAQGMPFLLQEVVTGEEISTEAYFDGQYFHLYNHTLEEKKFMAGGYGPNTGCSGNLIWTTNGPNKLFTTGLGKLQGFLRDNEYRGMVDLNTIVNEGHCWGLEFTPRFGYDASATLFSTMDSNLADFLYAIASGDPDPPINITHRWGAAARITVPPYPEDFSDRHPELHPDGLPIKGIKLEDAWRNCYMLDVKADREGNGEEHSGLCTAGVNGDVCVPMAYGHTPEGAWNGVDKLVKDIKVPNMQMRSDLRESTMKRLKSIQEMGWI